MKLLDITPKFVEFIPDTMEDGILYISLAYHTASHRCACGCGELTVTPLTDDGWKISIQDDKVTLSPSIGNFQLNCKSHYFITSNKIIWV